MGKVFGQALPSFLPSLPSQRSPSSAPVARSLRPGSLVVGECACQSVSLSRPSVSFVAAAAAAAIISLLFYAEAKW